MTTLLDAAVGWLMFLAVFVWLCVLPTIGMLWLAGAL